MILFATAAAGTEGALRDELRELRFRRVRATRGGVGFEGDLAEALRACLWSRIALRVLVQVGEFDAPDRDVLYEGVHAIDWAPHVSPRQTLAVSASCKQSALTDDGYVARKTKDAIVDRIRGSSTARPSVDAKDPDVRIVVHLAKNHATVHLDVSGESLHRRGWRADALEAPLRETLAAAVLRLSGWDRKVPLCDPMCGSGTIPIEADLWARGVAPGLGRDRFGALRWASADDALRSKFAELRAEAEAAALPDGPDVFASDFDPRAIELTRKNALGAGAHVRVSLAPVTALRPLSPPGFVVSNPPYGERISGAKDLYRGMAQTLLGLRGHTICLLSGSPDVEWAFRVRPTMRQSLFNGPIDCKLLKYDVG